jgi:preprotein translocase subunit SecY
MAGIVARVPTFLVQVFEQARTGAVNPTLVIGMFILFAALIGGVVFMERAQRRLLVQYPKRQQGNRVFGGESSHLPLKLNVAGVIPPIFASSLLLLPMTVANFNATSIPDWLQNIVVLLGHGKPLFILLYAFGIIFFCFFYTAIVFNPEETADNLKKYGGFIPGIRPGKRTAEYIDYVLTRITVVGAIYLATVCLIPEIIDGVYNVQQFSFGGTSILIVVSVTMDTVAQIQSHLIAQQYEGLIKKARLKGARPQK